MKTQPDLLVTQLSQLSLQTTLLKVPPTYQYLSRGSLTHCLSSELHHVWLLIPGRKKISDFDSEVLVLYQVAWRKTLTPRLETGPCPSLGNSLNDVSHCRLHLFWRKSSVSLCFEKTIVSHGDSLTANLI